MNYSTVYVGMDVHKESFSLCCYTNEKEQAENPQKVDAHYSKVINYIEAMRFHYGDDALFICGYEAGCLGFTLYHQLTVKWVLPVDGKGTSWARYYHSFFQLIGSIRTQASKFEICYVHNGNITLQVFIQVDDHP